MELELTETQSLVQKTTREFVDRALKPIASELDRTERFPTEILKELASLGIEPVGLAAILPTYLRRYRRGGRA